MAQKLALFDFDGTIAKGDSILPWVRLMMKKGEMGIKDLLFLCGALVRYRLGLCDMVALKQTTVSFLKGRTVAQGDALAEAFWNEMLTKRLFPGALEEIDKLRRDGVSILLVSASTDCYMRTVAAHLGAVDVLSTHCEVDTDGRYTGRITGANCRGEEKPLRINAWLRDNGLENAEIVSAWGDTCGDLPMLRMARQAHANNPCRKMQENLPAGAVIHHFSV